MATDDAPRATMPPDLACKWAHAHVSDLRWDMCVYPPQNDVFVSASIVRAGAWEPHLVSKMLATMRAHPGAVLLDIGSNVGFYALAAAAAGFRVQAFEPVPQNAARIEASLVKNGFSNVTLHTVAVGAATGVVPMGRHHNNQGGVAHRATAHPTLPTGLFPLVLPALRLDDVLGVERAPLYLKIDIEGGECDAFVGMRAYLLGARRIIGVNMEFGQSHRQCCKQWTAPDGAFDVFRRHGLCPRGTTFGNVCDSCPRETCDLAWTSCAQAGATKTRAIASARREP